MDEEDFLSSVPFFLALSMSFFESLFTIFFNDPIRPLPRLWTPSVDSNGCCVVLSAVGRGLLGRSGLVADWFDRPLVGLGGGGLLGGVIFVDLLPLPVPAATATGSVFLSSFAIAAVASVLSGISIFLIRLRTLASGVKLLILLGGAGLGLGVLMTTGSAPSPPGLVAASG